MSRLLNAMFVLATLSTVWLAANVVAADEVQIGNSLNEFVAAFNEKNAEKLAACWTETATHTDRETGERTPLRHRHPGDGSRREARTLPTRSLRFPSSSPVPLTER